MFIIRAGILVITTAISSVGDRSDSTFKLISIWPLAYVRIIHVKMECPINAITPLFQYNILYLLDWYKIFFQTDTLEQDITIKLWFKLISTSIAHIQIDDFCIFLHFIFNSIEIYTYIVLNSL